MQRKKNLSPSRLKHLHGLLESGSELTESQRQLLLDLISSHLEDKQDPATQLREWFRQGQSIVDALDKELTVLRQLTAEGGNLISKTSLLAILDAYKVQAPKSQVDHSVNWLLDRIEKDIAALPTTGGDPV